MSWFNDIPVSKWGTKQKKVQLTNEVKKIKRESKKTRRAHTIKDVKRNSQILDQQARIKVTDIKNIMKKHAIWSDQEIRLIAAYCVQEKLFDSAFLARMFIQSFKDKIFEIES